MENHIVDLFEEVDIDFSNSNNVIDLCTIGNYLLLEFCGGIPIKDLEYIRMGIEVSSSCVYDIEITTPIYHLSRTINFQTRVIYNNSIIIYTPNEKIGITIFFNQVCNARRYSFKEIRASAMYGNHFNGYYVWGRFGYTMLPLDKLKYENWCDANEIERKPLFDILQSIESRKKWINNGFTWGAIFSLEDGSENINLLKKYLILKGLGGSIELL